LTAFARSAGTSAALASEQTSSVAISDTQRTFDMTAPFENARRQI
jgi:hypothetical protein